MARENSPEHERQKTISRHILRGSEGWIFLNEGSNFSRSTLEGRLKISNSVVAKWQKVIAQRQSLLPNSAFIICPEKTAVFPQFLDGFTLDDDRAACQLAEMNGVIYPVKELAQSMLSYPKTGSHFSDYGAYLAVRLVLNQLALEWDFTPEWETVPRICSLSRKLGENIQEPVATLANGIPVEYGFNGLINRGAMRRYRSTPQKDHGRLLVFGDSFGAWLSQILSGTFSEVLSVHTLSFDPIIYEKFNPDYVLFECAERFLRQTPMDGLALTDVIVEKLEASNLERVEKWLVDDSSDMLQYVDEPALRAKVSTLKGS